MTTLAHFSTSFRICDQVLVSLLLSLLPLTGLLADSPQRPLKLWYDQPAAIWEEALPVGNGRLGAMVYGGSAVEGSEAFGINETLQFNEDTFWAGGPYDPNRQGAWRHLAKVQELVFAGKPVEAHQLLETEMMASPLRQMPYQPVADLLLTFGALNDKSVQGYYRDLDLETAVATTRYEIDGVKYTREVFSSLADQVIVVRLTSNKAGKIDFDATFDCPHKEKTVGAADDDSLLLDIQAPAHHGVAGALRCHVRLKAIADGGEVVTNNGKLEIRDANSAMLLLAADTNYVNYQDTTGKPAPIVAKQINTAAKKDYETLLEDHLALYEPQLQSVDLDLGTSEAVKQTTDKRIKEFARQNDPQLAELYLQFGRYLLIASSQPGTQPANLQGIWNHKLRPNWESKYTCNINVEMNYWPAEPLNLSECHQPLFQLIEELAESGQRSAKAFYNARGWVSHHNTDLWRASAPIDGPAWGFWPSGGAWLCQHLWYRYEYTLDDEFLRKAYPIMKAAAEFFLDVLVEDPRTGYLVTCPSTSPENRRLRDRAVRSGITVCAGPTMDVQLLHDLFTHCRQASEILDIDQEFRETLHAAESRFPPMQIGAAGQLQEWQDDFDLKVPERQHRHVSHLYGLFPSDQITAWETPDLFKGARKSLELRGDGGTGWSKGWKINLWAHLHDGDRAYKLVEGLITTGTYPNMFDSHPPFQIDGNFGGANGIAEMLVQSYASFQQGQLKGMIHILPALPAKWPTGHISGLRARGGFELDLEWRDRFLEKLVIRSTTGTACALLYDGKLRDFEFTEGQEYVIESEDFSQN